MLIGTDFYCYANAHKTQCILMHSLVGTFIEEGEVVDNGMWGIKVVIPPCKSRVIYLKTVREQKEWLAEMR